MKIKQNSNSDHLLQMGKRKPKMVEEEIRYRELDLKVLERERNFSLKYWAIRPSEFFGARSKAALRDKAYARALILGVFDKLREVGVLSYLSFTLCLSVLRCFGWVEA